MKNTKIKFLKIFIFCMGILLSYENISAQCDTTYNVILNDTCLYRNDVDLYLTSTANPNLTALSIVITDPYGIQYTTPNLTNVGGGFYKYVIYNSITQCVDSFIQLVIDDSSCMQGTNCQNFYVDIFEADSCNFNDVTLYTYISGGSGNYSYSWNTSDTIAYIANKTTGTYTVTVTDYTWSCTDSFSIMVTDDTCVTNCIAGCYLTVADPCGYQDVFIHLNLSGADPSDYSYVWSTGDTTLYIANKSTGFYTVTITNKLLGCSDTLSAQVQDIVCFDCVNLYGSISESDSCQSNDVHLSAEFVTGGSGSYVYQWNTGETTSTVSNKSTGFYSVTITDIISGCMDTAYIQVYDDTCNSCANFNAFADHLDGCSKNDVMLFCNYSNNPSFTFLWNTGETSDTIYNKTSGSYWVVVTNININCSDTVYIMVQDDTCNLCTNFSTNVFAIDSCNLNDVLIIASATNGSGNYSYLWNTGDTTSILTNKSAGSYWVIITDNVSNCVDTLYVTTADDSCDLCGNFTIYKYIKDSCSYNDVKVNLYPYGGSGNYSYLWSHGDTAKNVKNLSTGMYYYTVTDNSYGCTKSDSLFIIDSNFKCCKANFNTFGSSGSPVKTYNGYNNVSASVNDSVIMYHWNFADSTSATGKNVSHAYNSIGAKLTCFDIETNSGCKDTICKTIYTYNIGKNLKVYHFGTYYNVAQGNKYTTIYYSNIGSTTESASIEYRMAPGCSLISSSILPSSSIGNLITYNLASLAPGQKDQINVSMSVPSTYAMGSYYNDSSKILTYTNDININNNSSVQSKLVSNSYDPNDKNASPSGIGEEGNTPIETSEVNYRIRFQNEGNGRTYRVRVEDEISPYLDINSLALIETSHECRMVKNGNKITWYFDDIELTPKSQDEAKSQGFIQYGISVYKNLPEGTKIENTANIYFDNNPALITNTTLNTLKADENTGGNNSISQLNNDENNFSIVEINDRLNILANEKINRITIYDITGKLLIYQEINTKVANISKKGISKGIYIIQVTMGDKVISKKYQTN